MGNLRKLGGRWEKYCAAYLKSMGYEIVQMNYRCRAGEIDIIAKDGRYLVFIEVKYRKSNASGNPIEAVSFSKQKTISFVAAFYLSTHHAKGDTPVRFDVIAILGDKIKVIKNAFEYIGP